MKITPFFFLLFSVTALARSPVGSFSGAYGPRFHRSESATLQRAAASEAVHRWNQAAIDATGLDHTPVAPGENRVFGEQFGPGRSSRAMAIVHVAIFDAIDAVTGQYQSFTGVRASQQSVSLRAAVGQAAHDTLVSLYPSQKPTFDTALADELARVSSGQQKTGGIALGGQVAAAVLASRVNDGAELPESRVGINYFTSNLPGHWRQDPISLIPLALGSHWGQCKPFVIQSVTQVRAPAPPRLTSPAYAAAYQEAKNLGGDGLTTPTQRTAEQTLTGTFWAYDGTPSLCAQIGRASCRERV